jgi:hypothetical protein
MSESRQIRDGLEAEGKVLQRLVELSEIENQPRFLALAH